MASPIPEYVMEVLAAAPYPYMCHADIVDALWLKGRTVKHEQVWWALGQLRKKGKVKRKRLYGGRPLRPNFYRSGWRGQPQHILPSTVYWLAADRTDEVYTYGRLAKILQQRYTPYDGRLLKGEI